MTPDKVEAALGVELCALNQCTEPCETHRRWASRLASVLTEALAEREDFVAMAESYDRGYIAGIEAARLKVARYADARVFGNPHTRQVGRAIAEEIAALAAAMKETP